MAGLGVRLDRRRLSLSDGVGLRLVPGFCLNPFNLARKTSTVRCATNGFDLAQLSNGLETALIWLNGGNSTHNLPLVTEAEMAIRCRLFPSRIKHSHHKSQEIQHWLSTTFSSQMNMCS